MRKYAFTSEHPTLELMLLAISKTGPLHLSFSMYTCMDGWMGTFVFSSLRCQIYSEVVELNNLLSVSINPHPFLVLQLLSSTVIWHSFIPFDSIYLFFVVCIQKVPLSFCGVEEVLIKYQLMLQNYQPCFYNHLITSL